MTPSFSGFQGPVSPFEPLPLSMAKFAPHVLKVLVRSTLQGFWHLLANCGYSAADPDALYVNGDRESCDAPSFSTTVSNWGIMGLELYNTTINASSYKPLDQVMWIASRARGLTSDPSMLEQYHFAHTLCSALPE